MRSEEMLWTGWRSQASALEVLKCPFNLCVMTQCCWPLDFHRSGECRDLDADADAWHHEKHANAAGMMQQQGWCDDATTELDKVPAPPTLSHMTLDRPKGPADRRPPRSAFSPSQETP